MIAKDTHTIMIRSLGLLALLALVAPPACGNSRADEPAKSSVPLAQSGSPLTASDLPDYAPAILREPVAPDAAAKDDALFDQAARAAWKLIESHYYPATGLVSAQPSFPYPTTWDIASTLLAYHAARGLGLVDEATYRQRASRLLATLNNGRLYNGIAYGRNYDARTGELVGADNKPDRNGTGYSAIDVGRLLVALAVVAKHDPQLADAARTAAARIDRTRAVKDGYLTGAQINAETGKLSEYQEGRIGYEQYAAAGYALWGLRPAGALDPRANAVSAKVLGIPIAADKRGLDRLTSEPLVLHGLELGWDPSLRELAIQTLSVQAKRFVTTGQMTMMSEDAVNRAPYYFYYYCVYCSGKPFVVNVHSPTIQLDGPKWISTKAAFAWYAVLPSKYTRQAIDAVRPALSATSGWASGVYEGSNASTRTYSLNTAAVILEAALYRKKGRPLIS